MGALLLPFTTAQRERLFNNRPPNVGKGLALADWHRLVQFIEAAQQPCPSPVQAWAVVAPCGDGVLFSSLLDARWTLTGEGAGADGVGHPTIGEAFRECYAPALTLHRVQMTAQKGGVA
ncbi:hypothetical protein C380_09925 [Acidovorax sp. KKS102]|uniref:hypothetical protein n=1 Tax=Acidovorax sp. KKS102 TaxID=358220 RepID=UPI00028AE5DB|nr:hypothetical protein [Acidovorax sp. KKS102]AFU45685.1 hypothetical protein C380_09925 [Acidovorax sp. KKS102]